MPKQLRPGDAAHKAGIDAMVEEAERLAAGWINLGDPAPPGFFDGAINTDPYYISPEDERALEEANECPRGCDHGRVLVFRCKGVCECGYCPELEDCPECCGHED